MSCHGFPLIQANCVDSISITLILSSGKVVAACRQDRQTFTRCVPQPSGCLSLNGIELDVVIVPQSDPALTFSQPTGPMMKRKVSYRSLGDATLTVAAIYSQTIPELRILAPLNGTAVVAKMIQDGPGMHSMPPRTKRTRRNKTRISFITRTKKNWIHIWMCVTKRP